MQPSVFSLLFPKALRTWGHEKIIVVAQEGQSQLMVAGEGGRAMLMSHVVISEVVPAVPLQYCTTSEPVVVPTVSCYQAVMTCTHFHLVWGQNP